MATITPAATYGILCFARRRHAADRSSESSVSSFLLPEIHFNIWEREPQRGLNKFRSWLKGHKQNLNSSLDIGLMIDIREEVDSIELIFPEKISVSSIVDLSTLVSQYEAIPAIFNESWVVSKQGSAAVVHDPSGSASAFAVVGIDGLISETQHVGYDALSISVSDWIDRARKSSASTGQAIERTYIRFRLLELKRDFYCVGANEQGSDWWQPSWQRTEDIDFRLNVRRGAPADLESNIGRFIEFSKVHLFLMRSREKDIVFQDKLFKSSRSLEDEVFWAKYSVFGVKTTEEAEKFNKASIQRVKSSLGYQWKAGGGGAVVKEFGTLARFKIVEFGIGRFVAVAVVVGAMGNMLWDGFKVAFCLVPSARCEQVQLSSATEGVPEVASKQTHEFQKQGQSAGHPPAKKDGK